MNIISNCGILTPLTFQQIQLNEPPSIVSGQIPYFHQMLCRCATSIALQNLWAIVITAHNKNYLLNKLKYILPDYEPTGWQTESMVDATWTTETQDVIGCIFATAVKIPGETTGVDYVGITDGSRRGFINAPIITGRNNFETLDITYLETNQSFAEVIRAYQILVQHEGLIARPKNQSIKCDINIYQLAKAGENTPNIIRKAWLFKDCAPIMTASEELHNDAPTVGKRQSQFVYNSYSVSSNPNCGPFEGTTIPNAIPVQEVRRATHIQPVKSTDNTGVSTTPIKSFSEPNNALA